MLQIPGGREKQEEEVARRENGMVTKALNQSSRVSPLPLITGRDTEALKGQVTTCPRSHVERGEERE